MKSTNYYDCVVVSFRLCHKTYIQPKSRRRKKYLESVYLHTYSRRISSQFHITNVISFWCLWSLSFSCYRILWLIADHIYYKKFSTLMAILIHLHQNDNDTAIMLIKYRDKWLSNNWWGHFIQPNSNCTL